MRNIKFKAKRKDNNEWVYGYYHKEVSTSLALQEYGINEIEEHYIHTVIDHLPFKIEVIPETICEYTGLKDKNGVEIYENDILQLTDTINEPREKVIIRWNSESASYEVLQLNENHYSFDVRAAINPCEVIENIYDKVLQIIDKYTKED